MLNFKFDFESYVKTIFLIKDEFSFVNKIISLQILLPNNNETRNKYTESELNIHYRNV